MLPDDRASAKDDDNFGQSGFRVPTLMASPYARPGYVDHALYDHTSILRFLEWRFLGAPPKGPGTKGDKWWLTTRDRHASNIGASLMPTKPDPEFDTEAGYEVPVTSPPCEDNPLEFPLAASEAERRRYLEMHAFEKSLLDGYFERVGYKIDLRRPPVEALPVP